MSASAPGPDDSAGPPSSSPEHPYGFLTDEELDDLTEADDQSVEVTFSSQDYSVDALVTRTNSGAILVPRFGHQDSRIRTAGFQRGFVWSRNQMDRFIESLLLGYPVPGIFLVKQEDGRLLVLDGQQRLLTLAAFYRGIYNGIEFTLKNVSDRFKGLRAETLSEELRRRLDDSYMQATIVSHDGTNESADAIYRIFERLNSGGTQLTPHEIRIALVAGNIVELLSRLNDDANWRAIFGNRSPRLRDQELILRILALYEDVQSYKRPLKTFLNAFASTHRDDAEVALSTTAELFSQAAALLRSGPGSSALRGANNTSVNVAQAEAVFIGLMQALVRGKRLSAAQVTDHVAALQQNADFLTWTQRATADLESVRGRLGKAAEEFGN